jgi:hypothetical protein
MLAMYRCLKLSKLRHQQAHCSSNLKKHVRTIGPFCSLPNAEPVLNEHFILTCCCYMNFACHLKVVNTFFSHYSS